MKLLKYFNGSIDASFVHDVMDRFGLSKIIAELVVSRGFNTMEKVEEFLNPKVTHDPFTIRNMDKLVERVKAAISNKEKILIFGDYDVDGISATAIMIKTLNILGVNPKYYLPNRFVDGYGLTCTVIDKIKEKYNPSLIITVDCGISCYKEVEYAKSLGIEIIVTDHHEIPEIIPSGIVLNAKIEGQEYPFRELCGTGLAYKISEAFLGNEARQFLPIAAIATIADIVPLVDENRTIVYKGLKLLDNYLPIGLKMLFKEQKMPLSKANSIDISYKIAPKINASGRMGDAADSLKLYLETDPVEIKKLLEKVSKHNHKRQELCTKVYEDCKRMLEDENMSTNKCIILSSKKWDQGILGIVCARLVEEYNRPVLLFSELEEDAKGSARSIPEINVHLLLSSMKDMLETFGGHTVAAGLTLKKENLPIFKQKVNEYILNNINDEVFTPVQYYDIEVAPADLNKALLESMQKLEPFGLANSNPKFKISIDKLDLIPMKNFNYHCQIRMQNKINFVEFNYVPDHNRLKYCKNKSIIFELQSDAYQQTLKGIVRGNHFEYPLLFNKNFNSGNIETLKYCFEKSPRIYDYYTEQDLINFVSAPTNFGTAFVAFNMKDYNDFISNYNMDKIVKLNIFDGLEDKGFNALFLCPENIDFCRHYERIVFLSPVLDGGYIARINKLSDAKVYLPLNKKANTNFKNLDLSRQTFGKIYNAIKRFKSGFVCKEDLYNKLKLTVSYETFLVCYLTFAELHIIDTYIENGLTKFVINDTIKTDLNKSSVYNMAKLLKNVTE